VSSYFLKALFFISSNAPLLRHDTQNDSQSKAVNQMGDRRREYGSGALRSSYAEEAPTECRIEEKPGEKCCRQPPHETGKHVIVR
jgi:hypothetical protein